MVNADATRILSNKANSQLDYYECAIGIILSLVLIWLKYRFQLCGWLF